MRKDVKSITVSVLRVNTDTTVNVTYEVRLRKQALALANKEFPGWEATVVAVKV
jgi:hypothetical protein